MNNNESRFNGILKRVVDNYNPFEEEKPDSYVNLDIRRKMSDPFSNRKNMNRPQDDLVLKKRKIIK